MPRKTAHLDRTKRVNLGSFYTPTKFVRLIGEWLQEGGVNATWTIADLSCGDGAFLQLQKTLPDCHFIGNDIDEHAVQAAKRRFPKVEILQRNCLADVTRENFHIAEGTPLAIVGNPPYNDFGSIVGRKTKLQGSAPSDPALKRRDIGLSALLAYSLLKADFVAILHPLSYLLKPANFSACKEFFQDYTLRRHLVFSSHAFRFTSRLAAFPVIATLYERTPGKGLTYEKVHEMEFLTEEGETFRLNQWDYVSDRVQKYPHPQRYIPEILFYTMRDINALFRSKTFLDKRIANAVDVDPAQLPYYCYIDCFKRYAQIPYWMGNFNVPFLKDEFPEIAEDFIKDAMFHHPEVFGTKHKCPSKAAVARIRAYLAKLPVDTLPQSR